MCMCVCMCLFVSVFLYIVRNSIQYFKKKSVSQSSSCFFPKKIRVHLSNTKHSQKKMSSKNTEYTPEKNKRALCQIVHPLLIYDPHALDYIEVVSLEYFESEETKVCYHISLVCDQTRNTILTYQKSISGTCTTKSRST